MHRLFHTLHRGRRFARGPAPEPGGPHDDHVHGRGGPRHRRRWGGHGGGDEAGRVFDQGELRYVLLHLIGEAPRHGYELMKAIEDRLAGAYAPSPGVIYPTLTWLEELGYVAVAPTEGGRKRYSITEDGRLQLAAQRAMIDGVLARMDALGAARASQHAPAIVRAAENLKLALKLRTSRGALSEAEIDTIVTALDSAARAVERA